MKKRNFDTLVDLIRKGTKKKVISPYSTNPTTSGVRGKYGVDPVNTEDGEFNISPELNPKITKDIFDEFDDEYEFDLHDVSPEKDRFSPASLRKRDQEPSEEDLKDIEHKGATPKQIIVRKKKFIQSKEDKEDQEFIKARKEKYQDGFKMMGRDVEESKTSFKSFNSFYTLNEQDKSLTRQSRINTVKQGQGVYPVSSKDDEYILYAGTQNMGEEYADIKKISTVDPKGDLVLFTQELGHGLESVESVEGEIGDYSAVLPGDDMAYLACYRDVFIEMLRQSTWAEDQINELLSALDQQGRVSYEYYYEEGYLEIKNGNEI